jgi:hypothetical protein
MYSAIAEKKLAKKGESIAGQKIWIGNNFMADICSRKGS